MHLNPNRGKEKPMNLWTRGMWLKQYHRNVNQTKEKTMDSPNQETFSKESRP